MKRKLKQWALIIVLPLAFLMGCQSQQNEASDTSSAPSTQIPNPWTEQASLEEAEKLVGFSLSAPGEIEGFQEPTVSTMDDKLIQLSYQAIEDESICLVIRKAEGSEDISGDYNDYETSRTIKMNQTAVTLKGSEDKISLATWTSGDYAYAVSLPAWSLEEVQDLISQIK